MEEAYLLNEFMKYAQSSHAMGNENSRKISRFMFKNELRYACRNTQNDSN